MSANWRTTWLEQTGIPERKAQLEDRSHGQDASTEENNGNSEHRTNGTTEEPSPKPTTNTSPNNKLRQDQQQVQPHSLTQIYSSDQCATESDDEGKASKLEEGQTYRVQNPRNGRTRPVGITEMTKTTAPTTAQVNTTAAGQHQNIPVALAEISNGDTTTYEVIEYSSNAKAAQKFKQYKNTRPHSQASMAKWVKTSVTISNPKVIDEFHLTWNPTSKTYVIPRVVRQRNRSITAIQGRKTPAQNTGGNP